MPDLAIVGNAELAANQADEQIRLCIEDGRSFVLEAGAGAGKTHSLIVALKFIVEKQGDRLLRDGQQIACITYTNVARDEIESRTDWHPAILSATIHGFCWSLLKDFQQGMRELLSEIGNWSDKLEEAQGVGKRRITYELGFPSIDDDKISLHHNDVLELTVQLLENKKFRDLFRQRFPILFIDEYQDTDKAFVEALKRHFLGSYRAPLIGFFGDCWQKIYGDGCGKIEHGSLKVIGKNSNFRSSQTVVSCLNRMRPDLPQHAKDLSEGSVRVFHTNNWNGARQASSHWKGDLPSDVAHSVLDRTKELLMREGWDLSPANTKILMLTHNVLASEQGYASLAKVFPSNDAFLKKEDAYIAFFADVLEPACRAYDKRHFGEMFSILGGGAPTIRCHQDKVVWANFMDALKTLRATGSIGQVIDYILRTERLHLPPKIEKRERELARAIDDSTPEDVVKRLERIKNLKSVSYNEVIALVSFLDGHTPFATKHGVKGAEFENVIAVFGRGWNHYNFGQMLEWAGQGHSAPEGKEDAFERNRNLFYVVCSRPRKRLALLFTQELSESALATIRAWFGENTIHAMG